MLLRLSLRQPAPHCAVAPSGSASDVNPTILLHKIMLAAQWDYALPADKMHLRKRKKKTKSKNKGAQCRSGRGRQFYRGTELFRTRDDFTTDLVPFLLSPSFNPARSLALAQCDGE